MPLYTVVWTNSAQLQMQKIVEYVNEDSPKNAIKILENIAAAVYKALDNQEIYNADKYKINNDGTYRAFEKYHYRVSYRFKNNIIRVLRVRHTSMKPEAY